MSRRKGTKAERGLGIKEGDKETILSITGSATRRVLDRSRGLKTFWEVKNVLRLRLTPQLMDFMLYAQATGRKMRLYIRPAVRGARGTVLSPSLRQAIKALRRQGLIEIRYLKIF